MLWKFNVSSTKLMLILKILDTFSVGVTNFVFQCFDLFMKKDNNVDIL
jgi:hypothetical protein